MPRFRSNRFTIFVAATALALGAAHLARPTIAWAHAKLRKSEPSASSKLTSSPKEIRLWFTEKPELALTKIALADSTGAAMPLGAVTIDSTDKLAVRVPITTDLKSGPYTITWSTVAVDGHPLKGVLSFRVDAVAVPTTTDTNIAAAVPPPPAPMQHMDSATVAPPHRDDVSAIVARSASYLALLAIIGAVAFRYVVLPRVGMLSATEQGAVASSAAGVAALASIAFLIVAVARLSIQGNAVAEHPGMRIIAMNTEWGAAWRLQVAGAVIALIGFIIARARAIGWPLAALGALALSVATSAGGHAVANEQARALSLSADALHIIGAGSWLGSLLFLVAVGLRSARSGGSSARVAALVRAFSSGALVFAGIVVVTGSVSAWLRLGSLAALWTSPYGVMLIRKLVMVAFVAMAGAFNWKRVLPTLGSDAASAKIRSSATIELALAVVVVVMTAVLVGMPLG